MPIFTVASSQFTSDAPPAMTREAHTLFVKACAPCENVNWCSLSSFFKRVGQINGAGFSLARIAMR